MRHLEGLGSWRGCRTFVSAPPALPPQLRPYFRRWYPSSAATSLNRMGTQAVGATEWQGLDSWMCMELGVKPSKPSKPSLRPETEARNISPVPMYQAACLCTKYSYRYSYQYLGWPPCSPSAPSAGSALHCARPHPSSAGFRLSEG